MVQMLMGEDNAVQNGRVQLRFAAETPDESPGSGIEVEIRFARREPDTPGGPELFHHHKPGARRPYEFDKSHIRRRNKSKLNNRIEIKPTQVCFDNSDSVLILFRSFSSSLNLSSSSPK